MKYIDISMKIDKDIITWPDSKKVKIDFYKNIGEDGVNASAIELDSHTGTHIDAPKHFLKNDKSIDEISFEKFVGEVFLIEIEEKKIDKECIKEISEILEEYKKVIFKTKNTSLMDNKFNKNYVALNTPAAKEIIKYDLDLVGIDYLSIQKYGAEYNDVHRILLKNNILILEGLDLKNVDKGEYKLYAFPLNIANVEASPVRAVLEKGD